MPKQQSSLTVAVMAFASFLFVLSSSPLRAQVGAASLSGTVTDPSHAAMPNATVTVHGVNATFVQVTKTGSAGQYVFPTLLPGRYRLTVTAPNFLTNEIQPFDLSSGQSATLNVTLKIASSISRVTVESTAPLLQTSSASIGSTVSSTQVTSLPLDGRSFLNVISVEPGTVPIAPAGSTTNWSPVSQSVMPSVFGQRQKDNNFLIDGVDNRDPNLLGVALYPPPEAIQELQVNSGVGSAAYGRASGATIDIVTKSGTNQWHGDGWDYVQNNALNARSFFQNNIGAFNWNQFGGDLGGPLVIPHVLSKEKGWYVFGYYEGVRIHNAANYTALVPTAAQLSGDFSAPGLAPIYDPFTTVPGPGGTYTRSQFPGNIIPKSDINTTSTKLANIIFPAPNLRIGAIPGTPVNYINTAGDVTDGNQWDARVDHQFGSRDDFFARYTGANNPSYGVSLPSLRGITTERIENAELSDTHIFSPHFILTGRYNFMHLYYLTGEDFPSGVAAQTGLDAIYPKWEGMQAIPAVSIEGYQGVSSNFALTGPMREQTAMGDAHLIEGNHNIDFGVDYIRTFLNLDQYEVSVAFASEQTSNLTATSTGDGFASYLLGVPTTADTTIGTDRGIFNSNAEGAYIQDAWRHANLTVNGGLRWDYNSPPVDQLGLGTFDYDTGVYLWNMKNPITGAPANMSPGGIPPDYRDFAPRLGLAYAVTPRLVVRASGGIFYDNFGSNYVQASQSERGNWPFAYPEDLSDLNATTVTALWPNPFPSTFAVSTTPTTCEQCLNVAPSSSRTPYVGEWTFSLQRQFSHNLLVEADYFGSKGTKLTSQIIQNTALTPGTTSYKDRQLYPQYGAYILNGYNEWNSWYDALALRLQKRFSHGLSYLFSYTYSHNLDYVDNLSNSDAGITSNPTQFNGSLNKGNAGFNITNVLVASGTWHIPGRSNNKLLDGAISGWEISTIFTAHSGLPFSALVEGDYANLGTAGRFPEYASLVGNPNANAPHTPAEWFNTSAFAIPAIGTYGTAGRNTLVTDRYIDDDISLSKSWKLYERASFQLRADFFNTFNGVNFGYPSVFVDVPSQFGTVGSTLNGGRTIQMSGELHF